MYLFIPGAFFIPYCIALAFLGVPIFLLELGIGQFSSSGPFTCWKYSPIFTGMYIIVSLFQRYFGFVMRQPHKHLKACNMAPIIMGALVS
jgi:SNF family Na+-dependent transporter